MLKCNLLPWHKAEFSASLLQSSVSHDPSEIIIIYWFAAQDKFLVIISVGNICAAASDAYFSVVFDKKKEVEDIRHVC